MLLLHKSPQNSLFNHIGDDEFCTTLLFSILIYSQNLVGEGFLQIDFLSSISLDDIFFQLHKFAI